MFRKKITPDFSKREVTQQAPIKYTAPVQTPEALPERIMISKPLPLVVPPPPAPMVYPKVARQEVQAVAPVPVMFSTPLGDPLPISNSSFSPNLETFPTLGTSYFGGAGGSAASNWSLYPALQSVDLSGFNILNCSTIFTEYLNVSSITTQAITSETAYVSSFVSENVSTNTLYANTGYISTVSTQALVLDGNELSTSGEELLFNGNPIATVSSISTNVASWSIYPALSTILADNNNITGVNTLYVSSISQAPGTPDPDADINVYASLTLPDWTLTSAAVSTDYITTHSFSTITVIGELFFSTSTTPIEFDKSIRNLDYLGFANDVALAQAPDGYLSFNDGLIDAKIAPSAIPSNNDLDGLAVAGLNITNSVTNNTAILTAGAGNTLLINNTPIAGGGAAAWSGFPATQTVNMANNSLNNVSGVNLTSGADVALLTAGAGNVLNVNGAPVGGGGAAWATFPASANVVIPNHNLNMITTTPGVAYNTANLNANVIIGDPAQAPIRPDLTAYCGTVSLGGLANPLTAMNVYSIGSVGINSAAGISVSGGGGVAISGAGGVAISGVGALALNGGNVEIAGAGGVFVNGTGAITVTAGGVFVNGGGVAVSAGGVAITSGGLSVAGGAVTIGTLGVAGGNLTIYGGDLNMATVTGGTPNTIRTDRISSVGTNTLAISGVSTINGLPYTTGTSVISERATSIASVNLTAVTFATAQTILTFTITPTAVCDINLNVNFSYQTNSNTMYDIVYFAQIDGIQMGVTLRNSSQGVGHFANVSLVGSALSQTATAHTITIKAYAGSAPAAGNLTVTAVSAYAIANLV